MVEKLLDEQNITKHYAFQKLAGNGKFAKSDFIHQAKNKSVLTHLTNFENLNWNPQLPKLCNQ